MAKYLMIRAPVGEVGFGCAAVDGVQGRRLVDRVSCALKPPQSLN